METRYPFYFGYVLSFFSPAFYRQVAHQWKGAAIGYYSLLTVVVAIIQWIALGSIFTGLYHQHADDFLEGFPKLKFEDGKLSSESGPYVINLDNGEHLLAVDPERELPEEERDSYQMLITDSEFIQRSPTGDIVQRQKLSDMLANGSVNAGQMKAILASGLNIMLWVGALLWIPFSWVSGLIFALIFSLLTLLVTAIFSRELNYGAIFRLTIVATTPATLITTILFCFQQDLDGPGSSFWLWAGITVVYIVAAAIMIGQPKAPTAAYEQRFPPAA